MLRQQLGKGAGGQVRTLLVRIIVQLRVFNKV